MIERLAQTVAELSPQFLAATAHPKDDVSAETDPEDGASADDNLFRSALYQKVKTTSGDTVTAIDAFFDSLSVASAKGNVSVNRAIQHIADHRRQQDEAAAARSARENSPIADAMRKQARVARVAHLAGGLAYLAALPALKEQAEETYGPFQLRSGMVPFHLDLNPACEAIRKFAQRQRRQRPEGDYEVGRCKTAPWTRFTTVDNPAGNRRPANAWDALERSLDKPVTVTRADGTQTSSTRRRTSYDGLIRKAIAGDRAARTEVIRRMIDLSSRGLLSAPPRAKRARRKQASEEDQQVVMEATVVTGHLVVRETIGLFAKSAGADPGIVDHQYDALIKKAYRDNARRAARQRAADAGGDGTGGRAAKSASARTGSRKGGSSPLPPTRTRARAAPPVPRETAASSAHPKLPRGKVPVIKKPAAQEPAAQVHTAKQLVVKKPAAAVPVTGKPTPGKPGGKRRG